MLGSCRSSKLQEEDSRNRSVGVSTARDGPKRVANLIPLLFALCVPRRELCMVQTPVMSRGRHR